MTAYAIERGIQPDGLVRYLQQMDRFLETALARLPDLRFVGLTTWTSNYFTTLMALAHLKRRPNPPFVVLGGPHVSESRHAADLALRSGLADAVVAGEGEQALLELFRAWQADPADPGPVPGVLQLTPAGPRKPARKLMKLKTKPLPDFSCMPVRAYQKHGFSGMRLLPFEMSRGCTDRCSFCSEWVLWERYRLDAPDRVVAQMAELVRAHDVHGFWFSDSLLNGSRKRLHALAEGILASGLPIKWGGFLRAGIDAETAALIKRAGCEMAFVGVESLSDETLALMNKRMDRSGNLRGLRALLDAGLTRVVAGFIPGFPGDTSERFTATALELSRLQREYGGRLRVNVEPFIVSPGQPIFGRLDEFGLEPRGWDDAVLDLAPAYRDLTEGIQRAVTGRNQGLARVGQWRIAATLNTDADATPDPYLYATEEDLPPGRVVWTPLEDGWFLGVFKDDQGVRTGLLVSSEERAVWEETAFEAAFVGKVPEALAAFAAELRTRHLPLRIGGPRAVPDDGGLLDPDAEGLSPFAVCRDTGQGDRPVLLVDHHSLQSTRLPAVGTEAFALAG